MHLPSAEVKGVGVDNESRCAHYHSARDIIAIKMKCCGEFYACKDCHDELAGHKAETWARADWALKAVRCGHCGTELTINEYLECANTCPTCGASFNPGCRNHYHFYFDMPSYG